MSRWRGLFSLAPMCSIDHRDERKFQVGARHALVGDDTVHRCNTVRSPCFTRSAGIGADRSSDVRPKPQSKCCPRAVSFFTAFDAMIYPLPPLFLAGADRPDATSSGRSKAWRNPRPSLLK